MFDTSSSGFALRFPRILRIRNDKPSEEIDTLQTVQRLSQIGKLPEPTIQVEAINANTAGVTSTSLEAAQDAFKTFIAVVDRRPSYWFSVGTDCQARRSFQCDVKLG
ncbi:hypothetical protein [Nostoc sp. UIC 10630]|uniref:hypothetical protein n=1 Tax=Nostoc sp. UIC 10630 TaxID=2100146 RepID=UPI0013D771DB|nr:hypothetical protein [Nostoc sp. UIC 10630]NEU81740.1 hypothetical protein [Nostoc sp. UIC 10630]